MRFTEGDFVGYDIQVMPDGGEEFKKGYVVQVWNDEAVFVAPSLDQEEGEMYHADDLVRLDDDGNPTDEPWSDDDFAPE